jgi:hypothetical protein
MNIWESLIAYRYMLSLKSKNSVKQKKSEFAKGKKFNGFSPTTFLNRYNLAWKWLTLA